MNNLENEKIMIVIVLYKRKIEDCSSYQTLKKCMQFSSLNYQLIIYNNSPEYQLAESEDYQTVNSVKNGKLPEAYNFALNCSIQTNAKWLLLLDQDSQITHEYVMQLSSFLSTDSNKETVAVVPVLKDGDQTLSPKKISSFGWWEFKLKRIGSQKGRVVAFNSLSLLNVQFFHEIGGFSEKYPLDMLDHWYYNQIYLREKKVFVLNCTISHNLSFQNFENEVDVNRYGNFLIAENLFLKELGFTHYVTYKIKLFLRSIKQLVILNNKQYAKSTFRRFLFNS